jgi:hypothetical protein
VKGRGEEDITYIKVGKINALESQEEAESKEQI